MAKKFIFAPTKNAICGLKLFTFFVSDPVRTTTNIVISDQSATPPATTTTTKIVNPRLIRMNPKSDMMLTSSGIKCCICSVGLGASLVLQNYTYLKMHFDTVHKDYKLIQTVAHGTDVQIYSAIKFQQYQNTLTTSTTTAPIISQVQQKENSSMVLSLGANSKTTVMRKIVPMVQKPNPTGQKPNILVRTTTKNLQSMMNPSKVTFQIPASSGIPNNSKIVPISQIQKGNSIVGQAFKAIQQNTNNIQVTSAPTTVSKPLLQVLNRLNGNENKAICSTCSALIPVQAIEEHFKTCSKKKMPVSQGVICKSCSILVTLQNSAEHGKVCNPSLQKSSPVKHTVSNT